MVGTCRDVMATKDGSLAGGSAYITLFGWATSPMPQEGFADTP